MRGWQLRSLEGVKELKLYHGDTESTEKELGFISSFLRVLRALCGEALILSQLPVPKLLLINISARWAWSRALFDIPIERQYSIGMPNKERDKADVLQGTLDLMVLQTLSTMGPLHGYQIAARLEQVSAGALRLNMGTLYPSLMRLEQRGFVRAKWGVTENNRKARFYSITAFGRRQFAVSKAEWDRMVSIMHVVFGERS